MHIRNPSPHDFLKSSFPEIWLPRALDLSSSSDPWANQVLGTCRISAVFWERVMTERGVSLSMFDVTMMKSCTVSLVCGCLPTQGGLKR